MLNCKQTTKTLSGIIGGPTVFRVQRKTVFFLLMLFLLCSFTATSEALTITNMNKTSYEISYDDLNEGELMYVDRTHTFTYVPVAYELKTYIKTANDDKQSTGTSFLTFDISDNCTIYVAHDDRITTKPTWLNSFADTGDNLTSSDSSNTFSLYSKDFTAGTVTLGGNGGGASDSMYSVVITNGSGGGGGGVGDADITGISFNWSTHKRRGNGADNWAITWAGNDNQYTVWGDGWGYDENLSSKQSLGVSKIVGNKSSYTGDDIWYIPSTGQGGKSYGIVSISGNLYMWYGPGSGVTSYDWTKLKKSTNYGTSWSDASWSFSESTDLIMPTILNFGKDYASARDGYMYSYFIRLVGNPGSLNVHVPGKIDLARVPTNQIMNQSYYEFFAGMSGGNPTWTSSTNPANRQPVFQDSAGVGWNCSVSYNAPLKKYILMTEHSASFSAKLGIFVADEPWGPWTTLAYYSNWGSGSGISDIGNSFYWNFSNKWLSTDGEDFVMVFSGINAMDSWNTVEGSFTVEYTITCGTSSPAPADSASNVNVDADLSWTGSNWANTYDVYFGTDPTPDSSEFKGNQSGTTYTLSTLDNSTTYYWAIDEVNDSNVCAGDVWSFTTEAVDVAMTLETGIVSSVGSSWTTVTLSNTYTSMVVVAIANYDSNDPPGVVRIRNASGNSFDVRVDAAGGSTPSGVDVYYMVVEEGTYTVASDGVKMEAVKFTSTVTDRDDLWTGNSRTYSNSYTTPVVLGQIMTYNDASFMAFWCSGSASTDPVDSSNLTVGKHVGEDTDTTRSNETIGYIVIEAGSGTIEGVDYVAGQGALTVKGIDNSPPYSYSLSGLSSADVAIASMNMMAGVNGGWGILYGSNPVSTTSLKLCCDEDQVVDNERGHAQERLGYIVFETADAPGLASNPTPADAGTDILTNADLSWTAGSGASSHDVYFGTDSTPDSSESKGNQSGTTYDTGTMSTGTTYYWRIDEINSAGTTTGVVWSFTTGVAPDKASSPTPVDSSIDVAVDTDLTWISGNGVTSHDVYFGVDSTPDSGEFKGNQASVTYDPGTMSTSTTYYWRIDEINSFGTTTGDVWSFTTGALPSQATAPNPSDSATSISVNTDLTWTPGSGATSHDVYFGVDSTPDSSEFQVNQASTTFDPGSLSNSTTYYWRIDETNAHGTTTGTVWSFTTEAGTPSSGPDLEVGIKSSVGSSWTTVTLSNSYTSMVVVAIANYDNTDAPGVVRIRNASGSSFDVRVDAAGGSTPSGVDVYYMVVEEGTYTVASNGVKMEAVKFTSTVTDEDNSWAGQSRTYSNTYTSPVVLGQVMTYNDASFMAFWCSGSTRNDTPDSSNLTVGKHVGEDTDTTRSNETIGYIVIEAGSGSIDGIDYVAALGGDTVQGIEDSPPYTYSLSGLSTAEVAIASFAAMQGVNGGWGILYGSSPVSTTQLKLCCDEDQVADAERKHTTEPLGYIVFEDTSPPAPGQASSPSPTNAATNVVVDAALSWTAGSSADSHDVYFGTDSTPDSGEFKGNQQSATYNPGTLSEDTTYYWRIDEKNATGTTTGTVWSFTTVASSSSSELVISNISPSTYEVSYDDLDEGELEYTDRTYTFTNVPDSYELETYIKTENDDKDSTGVSFLTFETNKDCTVYVGYDNRLTAPSWMDDFTDTGDDLTSSDSSNTFSLYYKDFGAGTVTLGGNYAGGSGSMYHVIVVPREPVAHWKFDESSGSSAADSSVNSNTGTLYNMDSSDWITGKFGNALDFDGTNDYVLVSDDSSISFGTGSFSLSFWIKTTDTSNCRILINGTNGDVSETGKRYDIRYDDQKVYFVIDDDVTKTPLYSASTAYGSGDWVHVVAIRNRATDRMYLYRNAEADLSGVDNTNNSIDSSGESLVIGSGEVGEEHFQGAIDDVQFFNYAISDAKIEQLYYNLSGNSATSPWPYSGQTGLPKDADLSWTAGGGTTSHDVYFGQSNPPAFQGNQSGTTFDTGTLINGTTYYWRIDERNAGGVTTGVVWSFKVVDAGYDFNDSISNTVLNNYLSRAVSHTRLCMDAPYFEDDVRMLDNIGAKFIGRSALIWDQPSDLDDFFDTAAQKAEILHEQHWDTILQACVFEIVTTSVGNIAVPSWVFTAFSQTVVTRNFNYSNMLFTSGLYVDKWGTGKSVPDMSRLETRMWYYYLSKRYIDAGFDAIHYGQVELIGSYSSWDDMLDKVRSYADGNARRRWVLCDAHTHDGVLSGNQLFDFHSYPLRAKEVVGEPYECVLEMNHLDSIYGDSAAGTTPSGWYSSSLPYLAEFDHGSSNHPGTANTSDIYLWGYGEIEWFAQQSETYRNSWLQYAYDWVRTHDSAGWIQPVTKRSLAITVQGTQNYQANINSSACPDGFNQEDAIKQIFAGQ